MANYTSPAWGLNEKGELVAVAGTGTSNIVGFLSEDILPTDAQGRVIIAGLGSGGGGSGTPGADGKTILNGTSAPSNSLGTNGDFYIDTAAVKLYGPKAAGAWPAGTSLVGADGRTLLNGSGVPSNGVGNNGDFYIDTAALKIYGPKASGLWPSGVSLSGSAPQYTVDSTGFPTAIVLPNSGRKLPVITGDWTESQWTRALLVSPPPRQINAVKDLSSWLNDGQYLGSTVDADIYDSYAAYTPAAGTKPSGLWLGTGWTNTGGSQTVVGTLSASAVTSKALMLHQSKVQWDLNNGESLLIQQRFFIPDTGTTAATPTGGIQATTTLCGSNNSALTVQGLNVTVSAAGALSLNLRTGAATPTNQSGTFNPVPLVSNTPYCVTIYIDGALKTINTWVNGQQKDTVTNYPITGDTGVVPANYSTINPSNGGSNMGVGCGMTDATTVSNAQRLFTSHFRMTVLPAGLHLSNPGLVDYMFNRNPDRFMTDAMLVGAY